MSSYVFPTLARVGYPSPLGNGGASGSREPSDSRSAPPAEEAAFSRRVRAPWWQPLAPLLTTLLFGGALVLCAGASSPTPTVARMLAEQQQALDAPGSLETATYQLPSHWQWPSLSGDAPSEDIWEVVAEPIEPAPDDRVACDWGVPGSTC